MDVWKRMNEKKENNVKPQTMNGKLCVENLVPTESIWCYSYKVDWMHNVTAKRVNIIYLNM